MNLSTFRQNPNDLDILNGLTRDRRIYRQVVLKLSAQIRSMGGVPCTSYDQESKFFKK